MRNQQIEIVCAIFLLVINLHCTPTEETSPNCGNPYKHGGMVVQRYFIGKDSLKANPWTVMIMKKKTKVVKCLGVLLPASENSSSTVLTASRCVKKSKKPNQGEYAIKVYYGATKLSPVVKTGNKGQVRSHANLNVSSDPSQDLALLFLREPIIYNSSASPVCLGISKNVERNEICYVSIFTHGMLTTMPATVVPTFECTRNDIAKKMREDDICAKQLKSKDRVHVTVGDDTMYAREMATNPEQYRRSMTAASKRIEQPMDADQNGHSSRLIGQTPSSEAIERLPLENAERHPSAAGVAKTLICIQNWLNRVERRRSTEGIRYDLAELVKSSSKDSLRSRKESNASVVLNIGDPTAARLSSLKKLAKQWANKLFYETIDFKETWYKIWLGIVTLTYLYNLVTIIARFSFYELEEQLYSVWLALNYISDAVYLFDCYVELRLIFLERGMPVTDRRRVMKCNLRTKPFALSAMASLPTDHIFRLLPIPSSVVILSRFNRLLRYNRVVQFVNFAETETSMPNLFRTVQLMVIVYLIFHWATCFYFLVSTAYGLESDSWVYNSERILDVTFDCANSTCRQPSEVVGTGTCGVIQYPLLLKHYLLCLYWAALVLISVGEQPFPIEIGQYLFTIVNFVAGTLILAGLIGNVRIVIAGMNQQRSTFRSCFDGVKNFMEMRKVNLELRKRVISWFTYVWEQKHAIIDEDAVMAMLPMNLRTQLAIALHIRTLRKANLFKDCDPGLLTEMALKLKLQIFSPNDYICRKGEIGKDMYIVKQGLLNVVADDGVTVLVTLKEGSVFGELSIMDIPGNRNGNRRTTSVRSVGFSELFALSKSDLFESLEKYPEAKRLLLEKGREILRKDKLLIEHEPLPKNVFDFVEQEYDYESLNQLSRNIVSLKRQLAEKNVQVKRTCDLTEQRVLQLEQNCRSNYCTWKEIQ
ncbi:hypothetical protein M513_10334 [Trichuris suis]|uniref:Cyclic nucleotide-binding domain-containing protein n=1 Tax=Trichuris suis TaxID=68888 RepID=A0A085LUY3_9BILA|nr:hypothetical protein M513_10334 [Trichuris suis]